MPSAQRVKLDCSGVPLADGEDPIVDIAYWKVSSRLIIDVCLLNVSCETGAFDVAVAVAVACIWTHFSLKKGPTWAKIPNQSVSQS